MNGQAELPQASRDTHETEPFLDGDLNDLERNGVHGVHRRPPLLIKITGYRILNTALILAFGVPKAVLSYKGELGSATAMDWVMGTVIAIVMFWVGQFETVKPPVWLWFFHDDYGIVVVLLCRFILFTVGCALMLATPPAIFLRIVFAMWPLFNLSSPEPRNIASILRLFAYIMIVQLLFMGSFLLFFKLRSLYEQHVDVVLRERLQKRWNKLHLPGAQYKSDRLDNCAGFLSLFVLWILLSFYLVWLMSSA